MEFHEVDGRRNDPFGRDGDQGSRSSKRREAERRAAKIDEPGDGGETDVLDASELRDSDGANLPRLHLKKMSTGHHAVLNPERGKIHGFVSHDDLMAHAKRHDESKPAAREVMDRTKKLMERPGNENLSYSRAHAQVLMSDTALRERYNEEQTKLLL